MITQLQQAIETLKEAGCETPQLDAEVLLAHTLGCERFELYTANTECQTSSNLLTNVIPAKAGIQKLVPAKAGIQLDPDFRRDDKTSDSIALFQSYIKRRAQREPVAYIIGYKEFWSINMKATSAVLIPRPETEAVVERALEILKYEVRSRKYEIRILDLCTGSGCIAAALAKELPTAHIVVSDISAEALEIAKANLKFAGDRITFLQGDLFEKITGPFDLIVSNPPYCPSKMIPNLMPEVSKFEPHLALDGGLDGLDFITQIRQDALHFLKPNGWLILESGPSIETLCNN